MTDQDDSKDWPKRAEMLLASAAATGRLIAYADLAAAARIPGPHRIHQLTAWLEQLATKDNEAGQPLRSALVISKRRGGLPAPGFFAHCRQLGLYEGPESGPESGPSASLFHENCLAAFSAFQSKK